MKASPKGDVFQIDGIFKEESSEGDQSMASSQFRDISPMSKNNRGKKKRKATGSTAKKLRMENDSLKMAMNQMQAKYDLLLQ